MVARIRGWVTLAYTSVTMVLFFLMGLPEMVFRGTGDFCIWLGRHAWGPSILWVAGAKLEVRSAKLPDGPLIFACNHESALDIPALFAALPRNIRFLAKIELFQLPIFGWYMRLGGHVPVDRANRKNAIVFAEGTRSRDGTVHAFKKGPFVVAMEAGVPVVPVAISGAGDLNPKGQIVAQPGVIRVSIGEAVLPAHHPDKTSLLVEVRRRVIEGHLAIGGKGGDLEHPVGAQGSASDG
jgi:1-acyl-sn-glycerol-3-phosphate acyltransferase